MQQRAQKYWKFRNDRYRTIAKMSTKYYLDIETLRGSFKMITKGVTKKITPMKASMMSALVVEFSLLVHTNFILRVMSAFLRIFETLSVFYHRLLFLL